MLNGIIGPTSKYQANFNPVCLSVHCPCSMDRIVGLNPVPSVDTRTTIQGILVNTSELLSLYKGIGFHMVSPFWQSRTSIFALQRCFFFTWFGVCLLLVRSLYDIYRTGSMKAYTIRGEVISITALYDSPKEVEDTKC